MDLPVREQPEVVVDAHAFLMRVHYHFFMKQPRFWYERDLQEADMIVCVLASNLRVSLEKVCGS